MSNERISLGAKVGAALALALGAGCGTEPVGVAASQALVEDNGVALNGVALNGVSLNGTLLDYSFFEVTWGVRLNGTSLNGASSMLTGTLSDGTRLEGDALVGAGLVGRLSDGTPLALRIDGVRHGTGDDADIYYYGVSYLGATGAWAPLCGRDPSGAAIEAIPLRGTWSYAQGVPGGGAHDDDPTLFTFACRHAALAKCVEWGYKPWRTVAGRSLAPLHQSCTRMVRADYCGDGRSWTRNGTPIDFWDGLGLQQDTAPAWLFEAEWNEDGARCVTAERIRQMNAGRGDANACLLVRVVGRCGDAAHFAAGTSIMNRHLPVAAQ